MNVYLVQHAENKPEEIDPDKPLSDKGSKDIESVASFLSQNKKLRVDGIYHSGKTRARQTAEALEDSLSTKSSAKQVDGLQPLDDPKDWANRLSDQNGDVMLVGHMPHMSKLASHLITKNLDKEVIDFQNGGVVCLSSDDAKDWAVQWIVTPELVR